MADKDLRKLLKDFSKEQQKLADKVIAKIEQELGKGASVTDAMKSVRKKYPEFFKLPKINDLIVDAAISGMGVTGIVVDSGRAELLKELSRPWDASGFNLSQKIHTADKKMYDAIVDTLTAQMRANKSVIEIARSLYDGYGYGNVIKQQDLPRYLSAFKHAIPGEDYTMGLARKAAQRVKALSRGGAPNQALKAAYKQLLDTAVTGTDKALKNAIYVSVNEKSRYVSERIGRTEAAKAWADGFYSEMLQDKHVVGFKWKLGSRHPVFDVCDLYAKADMFNLGAGIYPKDQVPPLPAHPHCLCLVAEVYQGEIDLKNMSKNTDPAVNKWLDGLTDEQRKKVLGIQGAENWQNGDSWHGSLRGWQELVSPISRLKPEFIRGLMEQNLFPPDDNFLRDIANSHGLSYTVGKQGSSRFYSDDGSPIYPPNDGFIGSATAETLRKGTLLVDRYGKASGRFVAPKGASFTERSLPKSSATEEYHVYRIKQDLDGVLSGRVAPWFDELGLGWQYKLPDRIMNLLDYLEEVDEP